jgi:ribosomal protein RSM22 (predicted rRNA methylase)
MNWESLDWEVLDRLRQTFLATDKTPGPYWHTLTDLECYDFTFGERIGWKWDAVLRELQRRGWTPPIGSGVLDWGCGSGIAGRRVVDFFGRQNFSRLLLFDHSELAMDFAAHVAHAAFPALAVERASHRFLRENSPIGLLVISHVLNELDDVTRADLTGLIARSACVIWVEPGTHAISRALLRWREESQQAGFNLIAPCTHQSACGLLAVNNERHWCHHFAPPPAGIQADSGWVRFGQRAGIDLRALPYSFLVLDRRPATTPAGVSRILGDPRVYKGYAKIFNCSAAGVEELTLQQRVDRDLFKSLKRSHGPQLYRWTREGDRITAAEPVP